MTANRKSARQSLAFSTPQAKRNPSTLSRRSMSNLDLEDNDVNETLFTTLMNDPLKKVLLMQFLSHNKTGCKDIQELMKRKAAKKDKQPVKKTPLLSPIALHRKRALAAMHTSDDSSSVGTLSQKKYVRTTVPFDKLLQGVVAYVEIISKSQDRSAGVKALLKAMGAKISEKICKGITHAIIKDVPYDTYRQANMVKAHLVSVLWLEAVRKNHCKVPERDYPAFAPEAYGSNVSLLCEALQKDYAEVVRDEQELSRNLRREIKRNLSSRFSQDVINTSQDCDMTSIISGVNRIMEKSKVHYDTFKDLESENVLPETTSDTESEIGLVNGQITEQRKDTNISDSSGGIERSIINSISERLKEFSDNSSSTPSTNNSATKETQKESSENINKESQMLDALSELQVSNNNGRVSRSKSRSSNTKDLLSNMSLSKTPKQTNNDSFNLQVSSDSNKEPVGVSEPVPSLRISAGSSKRRTTASSALSSLRISTESNKSKRVPPGESEPIATLRISSDSSKRITAESNALSSLRISSDSTNLKIAGLETNLDTEVAEVNFVETPSKGMVGHDPHANVTQRKKKQPIVRVLSSSDDSVEKNSPDAGTSKKKGVKQQKRRLYDPNDPDNCSSRQNVQNMVNKNIEIAPMLMTPSAKKQVQKKLPNMLNTESENLDDVKSKETPSPSKKTKLLLGDEKFKTPGKPVRARKATQSEKKVPVTPLRRSIRRISSCSRSEEDYDLSQKCRRSTLEFLPKDTPKTTSKNKNTQSKQRKVMAGIVCSRFHSGDVQVFTQIVNKLGVFFIEDEVTEKTSHLVLAEPKRTVNLLRALARGCWILRAEWLYKSLEQQKWLEEEDFEMTEYSSAVQKSRLQRQAFGRTYSMDVFSNTGNVYIAKSSSPRCSDLQELVKICKGKVTTNQRNAAVIVGEYMEGGITCVSVNWLLDSITFYKTQFFKKYLLQPSVRSRRNSEDC